jgi:hypothetical protein
MSDLDRLLASYYPLAGDVLRRYADGGDVKPDEGWLATAQKYNRAAAHGIDQALFGFPSAAVHGVRALYSGDWSGEAQRRLDAKEAGLSDLKDITPQGHKALMELTSMPVPSNPHSAINAIAAGAGKMVPAIFAGIAAKTAPLADLERAKAAEAAGIPREQIWKDHGWFQGKDGKWRFEIDDSKASWHPRQSTSASTPIARLPEHLTHDAFFAAYPDAKNVNVMKSDHGDGGWIGKWGTSDPHGAIMEINPETASPRSVALHEAQHGGQEAEGFSPGSTPYFFSKIKSDAKDQIEAIRQNIHFFGRKAEEAGRAGDKTMEAYYGSKKDELRRLRDELQPQTEISPFDMYLRTEGEVEARAVQKRMDLTPDQRRDRAPWLDYDVPEANQIIGARR